MCRRSRAAGTVDGVAANTPAAPLVQALVAALPLETTLATVLDEIYKATGGAITPQAALRQIIEGEGTPGAAGANGSNGASGANGAGAVTPAGGAAGGSTPAKKRLSLRAGSRSLKGRPGTRVRVHFNVSSAAKLSYGGRKLAKGSRAVKSGANVLMVKLPRKHGNYQLVLKAVSADGQRAQTTVALHDRWRRSPRRVATELGALLDIGRAGRPGQLAKPAPLAEGRGLRYPAPA